MRSVLNVGGNNKVIPIPAHYRGWKHDLLDIDPRFSPDIVCDGRELQTLPAEQYDAVYCSHNLEHYFPHETYQVLQGFLHVLKPSGFTEIIVPDISAVMKYVVHNNLDINDVLYQSPAGPITAKDIIYGHSQHIETGNSFYAHKTGFSPVSLRQLIIDCGFYSVFIKTDDLALEIQAYAFKEKPTEYLQQLLKLKIPG
jgi:SAM-dependent methyltransferase